MPLTRAKRHVAGHSRRRPESAHNVECGICAEASQLTSCFTPPLSISTMKLSSWSNSFLWTFLRRPIARRGLAAFPFVGIRRETPLQPKEQNAPVEPCRPPLERFQHPFVRDPVLRLPRRVGLGRQSRSANGSSEVIELFLAEARMERAQSSTRPARAIRKCK